jgi:hypothetical protein
VAESNTTIHLFSDRSRAVNAELLPLFDSSSNSSATILTACCTEDVRPTRDVLSDDNAAQTSHLGGMALTLTACHDR